MIKVIFAVTVLFFIVGCSSTNDANEKVLENVKEEITDIPTNSENQPAGIWAGEIEASLTQQPSTILASPSFTYKVKNQTEVQKLFSFETKQEFAYQIKAENGSPVQLPTPVSEKDVHDLVLKQGEELTYKFELNDLPTGSYLLRVWLATSNGNEQYLQETTFIIE